MNQMLLLLASHFCAQVNLLNLLVTQYELDFNEMNFLSLQFIAVRLDEEAVRLITNCS